MTYGYIRVSTDKQTNENQRFEIINYATRNNLVIDEWIEETISATKKMNKRKLGPLLDKLVEHDLLICSELSRIGRNLMQIMGILAGCMEKNCQVHTIKDNFKLGADIQSQVLAFAFGLSAQIERQLISQRTKEALARRKAEGQILGRPFGMCGVKKLTGKEPEIQALLDKKIPYSAIGRILNVHRLTVSSFVAENMLIERRQLGQTGKKGPAQLAAFDAETALELIRAGKTPKQVADEFKMVYSTFAGKLKKLGLMDDITKIMQERRAISATNFPKRGYLPEPIYART